MTETKVTSEIGVEYVDHMGSDRRIVEAMLVSTKGLDAAEASAKSIEGRIAFLMRGGPSSDPVPGVPHGSPFECGALTVRVHAPTKVWWEWVRHRIGFSYNLESSRYREMDPLFYVPRRDRKMKKGTTHKSSSPSLEVPTDLEHEVVCKIMADAWRDLHIKYKALLARGIDNGLAAMILPQGLYFAGYVTCNPRSVMNFLHLRTSDGRAARKSRPLDEIDVAAKKLEAIFAARWPLTHRAWNDLGRVSP